MRLALRTAATLMLAFALGLPGASVSAQQTLPASAEPEPISLSGLVVQSYPPKPTMIESMASAGRGVCAHLRASPVCQLLDGLLRPLSALTGGMIPGEKMPLPGEQEQPGPEGTAAQVKAVEMQAPQRQAAIAQLQGIDVRYYPEAEATLISALRADSSVCVRLEAAKTIATLPVCTPPLIKALQVCIAGTDVDGNPGELVPAVREQATVALNHCECCSPNLAAPANQRPEYPESRVVPAAAFASTATTIPPGAPYSMATPVAPGGTAQALFTQPVPSKPETIKPVALPVAKPKPSNLMDVFRAAAQ
ncbi:hypothetical protein CA51_43480 [Rosistilla oblonga]|uniref:hypothetical protein n=1 Tax=Rosistilla oblonga TaxID=2527990 RepID=UPI00118CAE8F|nr:hypothetical protein [Rosistilla oblonga]QDV14448.1 hypothetical protein CA51_43480 [Rosistilla oblonga]